jgi:hypothetical protein
MIDPSRSTLFVFLISKRCSIKPITKIETEIISEYLSKLRCFETKTVKLREED